MNENSDVEMQNVDEIHPMRIQLEEAEECIDSLNEKSDPKNAIKLLQDILAFG